MGPTQILFWFLSVLSLFSAIMVVVSKNPVHSVLWLIVVFFAISGHYILLNAQFLAIVNLIVYAGAIMVLFLFVIMLMNMNADTEPQKNKWLKIAGVVAGGSLLLVFVAALKKADLKNQLEHIGQGDIGLIHNLGKALFTDYLVPFELSSVLFLSAMVGAVVIAKKDHYFYVHRAYAECREPFAGSIFQIEPPAFCKASPECGDRWSDLCVLYYGGGRCRSKRWSRDHRDDVQEYPFGGCEFPEPFKTLILSLSGGS
jgi:NADH-quinone oxidoreductase subunit J